MDSEKKQCLSSLTLKPSSWSPSESQWCCVVYVVSLTDSVTINEVFEAAVRRISTWTFLDGRQPIFHQLQLLFHTEREPREPRASLSLSVGRLVLSSNHVSLDFKHSTGWQAFHGIAQTFHKRSTGSPECQWYGLDQERLVTCSDPSPRIARVLRDALSPGLFVLQVMVQVFGSWRPWPLCSTPAWVQCTV